MGFAQAPGADALVFLPLVGIVTGLIAGATGWAASLVTPHAVAAAIAFAALILVTGAIHIDGFLDSSDALFASVEPHRRLDIMKDPRHGTYAIAAFAALGAVWLAAIWCLPPRLYPGSFALSAGTARWAMTLNAFFVPYAREGGLAEAVGNRPPLAGALGWGAVFCATGYFLSPIMPALVPLAAVAAAGIGSWARGRLGGGLTGDVYGFGITVLEAGGLLLIAAVQASTWAPRT